MAETTNISWAKADKIAARVAVNAAVAAGRLPSAKSRPCTDCGQVWVRGLSRHEYDHHLGYAPENWLEVEPVCSKCHKKRDSPKAAQTHCKRGHEFTPENTGRKSNGTRFCRACRPIIDNNQRRGRDAAYWRTYRAERKARHG